MIPYYSLAICAVVSIGGCQVRSPSSVHGKVTLDGEPVAMGNIAFLPEGGSGSRAAAAIEQGAYAIAPEDKLRPGSYRVEISWRKATGRQIASADPGMMIDETREAVPAKYNTDSTLTIEIGSGDLEQDFDLSSK